MRLATSSQRYAFLGCLGFEARAVCVFRQLCSDVRPPARTVIFFNEDTHLNSLRWKEEFKSISNKILFNDISYVDPIKTADVFIDTLDSLLKNRIKSLVIDVTTFTREWLLILIALLRSGKYQGLDIEFAYNYASSLSKEWLSTRPLKLRTVLGYPGVVLPSRKNHLFLILGHEIERALSIIDEIEPAQLTIITGTEQGSVAKDMYERNIYFKNFVMNNYGNISNHQQINIRDYQSSYEDLGKIIPKNSSYNIILSPLNTKISTLAAGFFALQNKNVQICYLPMEQYNQDDFSTPSDVNTYFSVTV